MDNSTWGGRSSTQRQFDLERKVLNLGTARPGEVGTWPRESLTWVFYLGRAQPEKKGSRPGEQGPRPKKSSTWRGNRPKERSIYENMSSTQGEFDFGRKFLDPGKARPVEVDPLPRKSLTWAVRLFRS
ncbi:hypothetical protein FNV43_RR04342 [Rhamnella rubrinervis]|uniref:Uncharacterized protein n=1 Tax=Rhamnella rubrinervis TaxID=2594499 RepID=A0A8K0HJE0_9ROSA|nr:hypothetical protein FNV43_RR04342 [Rhamnella rubrinervis]